jgi:hypothetical protein
MDNVKEFEEMLDLVNSELDEISNKYNPGKIEFEIEERVWYISYSSEIVESTVVDIDDWSKGGTVYGGLVYYWIIPDNAKTTWIDTVKYRYSHLFGKVYMPPKEFPGHAISAGEEIFRTKKEAERALHLYFIRNSIDEYLDYLRK